MATRSVTQVISMAVSVYFTVMKAMRDQVTLQPNVNKIIVGQGQPLAVVSLMSRSRFVQFYFHFLLLQLVLCRVAALKSLSVHHPLCRLYFPFGPLRSARVF